MQVKWADGFIFLTAFGISEFCIYHAHYRLNAPRITAEKDVSSFNVAGALNCFRLGQNRFGLTKSPASPCKLR